jgi:hypothetical protein
MPAHGGVNADVVYANATCANVLTPAVAFCPHEIDLIRHSPGTPRS